MVGNHIKQNKIKITIRRKMACKRRVLAVYALVLSLPALAASLPGIFRLAWLYFVHF